MHKHVQIKFIHAKVRAGVLPTAFAVILAPVALPILLKVEFNFEVIIYITIFVSHIRKAALNSKPIEYWRVGALKVATEEGSHLLSSKEVTMATEPQPTSRHLSTQH